MEIPTPENGAIVKGMMKVDYNRYVVLARYAERDWVVWRMDNDGECYWGNYFGDKLEQATERFFEICKHELKETKYDAY